MDPVQVHRAVQRDPSACSVRVSQLFVSTFVFQRLAYCVDCWQSCLDTKKSTDEQQKVQKYDQWRTFFQTIVAADVCQ